MTVPGPRTQFPVSMVVSGYPPAVLGGGPIRTAEAMVEQKQSSTEVNIFTSAYDLGQSEPMTGVRSCEWTVRGKGNVFYADVNRWRGRLKLFREIRHVSDRVIYLNSLFSLWFSIVPAVLHKVGYFKHDALVLAPRGELDAGALKLRSWKKRLFIRLSKVFRLHSRTIWHASSILERRNIQSLFPLAKVVVKEDEVLIEESRTRPSSEREAGPLRLVHLGRISPKKQLHLLLVALSRLPPSLDYVLNVYGDGDPAYLDECKRLAAPLGKRVFFAGAVPHEKVAEAFAAADFACFPTAGENFGHVIPEALAQGCPVAIGDVTPWTPWIHSGGGHLVNAPGKVESWEATVLRLLELTQTELIASRAEARRTFRAWQQVKSDRSFLDLLAQSDFASNG